LEGVEPAFYAWMHQRFDPIIAARQAPEGVALTGRIEPDALEQLAAQHPGYYDLQMRLGESRAEAGDAEGAYRAWRHAAELLPMATGDEGPRARIVRLALARGDSARAVEPLEAILAREGANIDAARQLAALLDGAGDHSRAAKAWARVAEIDPFDATASAILGRQALDSRDAESASRWFRAALAAGPSDRAAAHCDLAESYLATGQSPQAKRQVLAALEVAPTYSRAQDLLLAIVDGGQ
jgi:tetratricopeptide (TPR) repeat protein